MPHARIQQFLDENAIKYIVLTHSPAYTNSEIGALATIPGSHMATAAIALMDGTLAMALVPVSYHVNLSRLQQVAGCGAIAPAGGGEIAAAFPDCEPTALPALGNLYGMRVFVERSLTWDREIVFPGGAIREWIRMKYADFAKLANPVVADFAAERASAFSA